MLVTIGAGESTRASFAEEADVIEFVTMLERFERGELCPEDWRGFRVTRGVYAQRQPGDAQMLRVRVPQGVLTKGQLEALADVAERYARGVGQLTTRQNVQFHFVRLRDVEPAMRRLAEAGLTTRDTGGSAIRNITTCPYAGVAADEVFDVTPYAEALTRYFLRHPLSALLPRKFKIAFEGCAGDHVALAINDLGFKALYVNGGRGFRVTVGGGTATLPTAARVIHECLPASDVLRVAESVVRVYHRLGDYHHKRRNRLKFLIRALGWTFWEEEYGRELAACRLYNTAPVLEINPPTSESGPASTGQTTPVPEIGADAFERWRRMSVRPQQQSGRVMVIVTLPVGELTADQMRVAGTLARAHGDGTVRLTPEQNLLFQWIDSTGVRQLHDQLIDAMLEPGEAGTIADITSCPGAELCRLGITRTRGLARLLHECLRARPDLIAAAEGARIKISGCPNGCGHHHIATIGFQGSVRRCETHTVPQYFVMVGGDITGQSPSFARLAAKIPARRIPDAVQRLVALYTEERRHDESAPSFFARVDINRVKCTLAPLARLSAGDATLTDFIDLGDDREFTQDEKEGECSS